MTVTINTSRPDPKKIKGAWVRERVERLLAHPELDRSALSSLINIERQFGATDLDYLLELRAWHDRVSYTSTRTYDVE